MSTTTVTKATLISTVSLPTLAWREVKRYARHPLFLVCLALLIWSLIVEARRSEISDDPANLVFFPVLLIGLFGTIVAYRLAKSMRPAREVADGAPVPRTTRTAALCLATGFPAAVGAIAIGGFVLVTLLRWSDAPAYNSGMTGSTMICIWLAGAVACAGGPMFGILVARWTNFPGAGLLSAVVLIAWTLSGAVGYNQAGPSRIAAFFLMQSPDPVWTGGDQATAWQIEGSPLAHLVYIVLLCLIGATLAIVRDAEGEQRKRLWRVFGVLVLVAIAVLGVALLPEPVRTLMNPTA